MNNRRRRKWQRQWIVELGASSAVSLGCDGISMFFDDFDVIKYTDIWDSHSRIYINTFGKARQCKEIWRTIEMC